MKAENVAVLGYGRAGKDTAAMWLGMHVYGCHYVGSTSDVVNPLIARERGMTPEENWATRHQNRKFWYDWCNEFRKDDPTKIARATMETGGNIIVGLRDKAELEACRNAKLFGIVIWVDNPRVPPDPTVTFTRSDCDIVVDNDGSFAKFFSKLTRLFTFAGYDVLHPASGCKCTKMDIEEQDPGPVCTIRWMELVKEQAILAGLESRQWLQQCNEDYLKYLGRAA